MKKFIMFVIILLCILASTSAYAATVVVTWTANTEPDVVAYEIYYGNATGVYGDPVIATGRATTTCTMTIPNPPVGQTFFFALKAVDAGGLKSGYSVEASCYIPDTTAPSAPKGITIIVRVN